MFKGARGIYLPVNDEGKLLSLRGYRDTGGPRNAMVEVDKAGGSAA